MNKVSQNRIYIHAVYTVFTAGIIRNVRFIYKYGVYE